MEPSLSFVQWKANLRELNSRKPNCRETQSQGIQPQGTQSQENRPQANQLQATQPQLTRTTQGRREVQLNSNDNTLVQGSQGQGSTFSTKGVANINSTTLKIQEKTQADTEARRTVPAILKYGKKKMLVNCFLDEGSNITCVNEDVVEERGEGVNNREHC